MDQNWTLTEGAVTLEPADPVHAVSGFVAKLGVGGHAALLTTVALDSLIAQAIRIRDAGKPAGGAITSADMAVRR